MSLLVGFSIAAAVVFGSLGLCAIGFEAFIALAEHRLTARREEELDDLLLEQDQEGEFVNY